MYTLLKNYKDATLNLYELSLEDSQLGVLASKILLSLNQPDITVNLKELALLTDENFMDAILVIYYYKKNKQLTCRKSK